MLRASINGAIAVVGSFSPDGDFKMELLLQSMLIAVSCTKRLSTWKVCASTSTGY